ncbi:cystathionine beta-lyase [Bifidobacterium gallicum DSM 20093 = LMG 11596]|nr:cystathionine beta-lyase [Bifidobacterium gallicum DSM 20093 = LMG 11596]
MTPQQRAWFDEPVDRSGTNSLKWSIDDGELPLWVADMDFRAAPSILEAVQQRAAHGIFGYSVIDEDWAQSYVHWWSRRHQLELQPEWLNFATGVIPILSSCVREFTAPGDNVLVQTPVYNIFFNVIHNNNRNLVDSPLRYDAQTGEYSIDFEDLEAKLADPNTTMMILCNPHNPIGKIWDATTLQRIGELCVRHGVMILEDSIHCDITDPGVAYVPLLSLDDRFKSNTIMCVSPTKAFNIAGLLSACAVVPDASLCKRVHHALQVDQVCDVNAFAVQATVAAFNEGESWLDAMREYVAENKQLVRDYLAERLAQIRLIPSRATYVLWLDCTALMPALAQGVTLADDIRRTTGLFVTNGAQYGGPTEAFLRMNVACPQSIVIEALHRLEQYFNQIV